MNTGELLALLTALLWSVAVIFFKKSGERVHPIALSLFKDILAFLLFLPTAWIVGQELGYGAPGRDWWALAGSGLLGLCIADTLFFYSLQLLGAGLSAIVNCLYSPAVIALSMLVLGERLTALQLGGVAAIVTAVALATSGPDGRNLSRSRVALGLATGVGAVLTSAGGIVLMKPVLGRAPLLWVTQVRLAVGIAALLVVLAIHPRRRAIIESLRAREGRGFTLAGSFIGAYLALLPWAAGFKLAPASTTSALQQTSYLLVFLLAVVFLKEPATAVRIVGIVLGMAGVYLVTLG